MNILQYEFDFDAEVDVSEILVIASSPVWHVMLLVQRLLDFEQRIQKIHLVCNHPEYELIRSEKVILHTYSGSSLTIEVLSDEVRERLKKSGIKTAVFTSMTQDMQSYIHIFRLMAHLGMEKCFCLQTDFSIHDNSSNLERYYPFYLGSHEVSGCIGVHKDESQYLYRLAAEAKGEGTILEIGCFTGGSSIALALGSSDAGNGGIYAVDIRFHPEYKTRIQEHGVSHMITNFQMPSRELALKWNWLTGGGKIRLLWIDGGHSYEDVCDDILLWQPFMEPGSTICLHDCYGHHSGVIRAVYELIITSGKYDKFHRVNTIFSAVKV